MAVFLSRFLSLISILFFLTVGVAAQAAPPVNVLVCFTVQSSFLLTPLHGRYAVSYYAPLYPNVKFSTRIIGLWEGTSTARGIARAFATNSTGCDIFIGPGTSTFALALNALVDVMWIAYSATSTQLSDRVNYPLFSRTVPTDAKIVRGVVSIMVKFGWLQANALCADTSNGQSLTQSLKDLYAQSGGVLLSSDCLNPTSSLEVVRARVQKFLASPSRVIFLAVSPGDAVFQNFLTALTEPGVINQFAVFASPGVCGTGTSTAWRTVPGTICALFSSDSPPLQTFRASYLSRDLTPDLQSFSDMNWPVTSADLFSIDSNCGFSVDGVNLAMKSMSSYIAQFGGKPTKAATAVAWLRNQSIPNGVTGPVTIPTGDRDSSDMAILATANNGTAFRFGNLSALGNLSLTDRVYVFGAWYPIDQVPSGMVPVPGAAADQPYWVIAIVGVVLLAVVGAATYQVRAKQALATRPLDATKPFAVMFVGVKNVAELQDLGAEVSSRVMSKVAATVRAAARSHSCFEARRIDESTVMITAKCAEDALACASAILEQCVMKLQWERLPTGTAAPVNARDETRDSSKKHSEGSRLSHHRRFDQKSVRSSSSSTALRTRSSQPLLQIGVHFGFGAIDYDEENNTVSYHGAAVERAAVVSDAAVSNQILVSRELINAMEEVGDADQAVASVGRFRKSTDDGDASSGIVMFAPVWMTAAFVADLESRMSHAGEGGDRASGHISAALQQAEAGLSMRRIGAVWLEVPWLAEPREAKDLPLIARLCEELEDIALQHRAEVQSIHDGCFLFALNAGVPCTMPVVRAASIAVECVQHCTSLNYAATAGVSVGAAAAGRQAGRIATFGAVTHRARAAQAYAKRMGAGVILAEAGYEEVAARFHVLTLGVLALPPGGSFGRAVSIIDARDSNVEGEWLYAMGAGGSALERNERAWEHVLRGALPPADDATQDTPQESQDPSALSNATALNTARATLASLISTCVQDGSLPLHAVQRFAEGKSKQ